MDPSQRFGKQPPPDKEDCFLPTVTASSQTIKLHPKKMLIKCVILLQYLQ